MKPLLFLFALIFSLNGIAQSFEGKIVYSNLYKSKIPGVTDQQLTTMMGARQEYYIKGGKYKSVTNGTYLQWQLYSNQENILYNKMSNSDTLLRIDAATGGDYDFDIMTLRYADTLLGYDCDLVDFKLKSGSQTYLYNSKFTVDPEDFRGHHFGNWYQLMLTTKAIPLRAIIENDQFILECTALEVIPQKLEDKLFQLP